MNNWRVFPSRTELDSALAAHIAEAMAASAKPCLAVSGGSTPRGFFQQLSRADLNWQNITVTLVDERWLAPDHIDSNERLVRENLLCNKAANAVFVGLTTDDDSAMDAQGAISQRVASLPHPFTAVVLGMGRDGHTASWFPRAENLSELLEPEAGALALATDPVTAPYQRMSLTLPAVLDTDEIIIHITGDDKRGIILDAVESAYPIAAVLTQDTVPVAIWWAPND